MSELPHSRSLLLNKDSSSLCLTVPSTHILAYSRLQTCLGIFYCLMAQTVKTLPAVWETRVQSLEREDSLKKYMATHSRILASRMPWTEKPGRLTVHGVTKSWTRLSD